MEPRKHLGKAATIAFILVITLYYLPSWKRNTAKSVGKTISVSTARTGFRFEYDDFCDTRFNSGGWVGVPNVSCDSTTRSVATCGPSHADNWQWSSEALRCGAKRQGPADIRKALAGRWIVVAGDSIARFFFAALLRLASDPDGGGGDLLKAARVHLHVDEAASLGIGPGCRLQMDLCIACGLQALAAQQIVYGHRDFEYTLPNNIRATFKWAPYISNLTALFGNWTRANETPDAVVMSVGLWHMLHIDDPADYAKHLQALRQSIHGYVSGAKVTALPPMSFFSISEVYPPKLKTEEKREHLTYQNVDLYNEAIQKAGLLVPDGALYLVDLHHLTHGCGPTCTHDGLHYSNATYDAALQIWAVNTLSVMSS